MIADYRPVFRLTFISGIRKQRKTIALILPFSFCYQIYTVVYVYVYVCVCVCVYYYYYYY
jgi:hypothetical protein